MNVLRFSTKFKGIKLIVLRIRSTQKPQYWKIAVLKNRAVMKNRSTENHRTEKPQNWKTAELKTAVLKIRSTRSRSS